MDYEQEQLERVQTVVKAALLNPGVSRDIRITTCGNEPSASVVIPGYVFARMLKAPKVLKAPVKE